MQIALLINNLLSDPHEIWEAIPRHERMQKYFRSPRSLRPPSSFVTDCDANRSRPAETLAQPDDSASLIVLHGLVRVSLLCLLSLFLTLVFPGHTFGQGDAKKQDVLRLTNELLNGSDDARKKAALDLAPIGKDAVPGLVTGLKANKNPDVLAEIDAACITGGEAVPKLIDALQKNLATKDVLILRHASNALACIAETSPGDTPGMDKAVPLLMTYLETGRTDDLAAMAVFTPEPANGPSPTEILRINDNLQGFDAAAHCLGRIGQSSKDALPLLMEILSDERYRIGGYGKIESISLILNDLIRNADFSVNDKIQESLDKYSGNFSERDRRSIEQRIARLKKMQAAQATAYISREALRKYSPVLVFMTLVLAWLTVLLIKPLWLLKLYEGFPISEARLPAVTIPIQYVLAPLIFRPRVLDAWVSKHLPKARAYFSSRQTVKDRRTHVPVGLFLDGRLVPELKSRDLRETFDRNHSRLMICGVGGSGKTSLACQIAHWAMREREDERLASNCSMLPVLLEHDFADTGEDALRKSVSAQLCDAIDARKPISKALLEALLQSKRILLLIDGMSEMSEGTRSAILSGINEGPFNAVLFTSRADETIGDLNRTSIKPTRIKGNQLSSFVESYLTSLGRKELFQDEEFFEGCRRLSMIVGDREITALLARLFVEQMVAKQEKTVEEELPTSIPSLMLQSIQVLHAKTPSAELGLRDVIKSATLVAWECLKDDYRPLSADYEEARNSLADLPNGVKALNYLKDKLELVETTSFDQKIRFKVDPLAEYLAGIYLVEQNGGNEEKWNAFLDTTVSRPGSPENIRGFLLALRDCCEAGEDGVRVPAFVIERLTKITTAN